jgi:hypothetical protein
LAFEFYADIGNSTKKHRCCQRYFPDALKGRKGEKEIGILNCVLGPKSRGERM